MPKGMPWFRLYAEFAFDPKLQAVTETLQRRYIMLLCLKCNGDIPGLNDEEVACALRIAPDELAKSKKKLLELGVIADNFDITKWSERQHRSDSSAERVARFRNKNIVTLLKRYSNANVTPPDTDTDTDTEKKKKKGRGLFTPPSLEEVRAYIQEKGYTVNPDTFLAKYESNGWMVGKNRMKDWRATVRYWQSNGFNSNGPKGRPATLIRPPDPASEPTIEEKIQHFQEMRDRYAKHPEKRFRDMVPGIEKQLVELQGGK